MDDWIKADIDEAPGGLSIVGMDDVESLLKHRYVFTVSHGMGEKPTIKCPICDKKSERSWGTENKTGYVRGDGFLDKAGCRREMQVRKLKEDDPYAKMRESGEKDWMVERFNKAGQRLMMHKVFSMTNVMHKSAALIDSLVEMKKVYKEENNT